MEIIFWIIVGILFYCFGLFVVYIADNDINRMMRMSRLELCVAMLISILLWIYESYKMNNWSILTDRYSIILI